MSQSTNIYRNKTIDHEMLDHDESHKLMVQLRELENKLPDLNEKEAKQNHRQQERIRGKLILGHMGMIKSLAYKYNNGSSSNDHTDFIEEELISAGVLGFMKALPLYFNKPVEKFSSWIYLSIRKQIHTHLGTRNKQCSKQEPYLLESLSKVVTCALQLHAENGVYPTVNEVAQAMHISPALVEITLRMNVGFINGEMDLSSDKGDDSFTLFDTLTDETELDSSGRPNQTTSYGDSHCLSEKIMELPPTQSSVLLLRGYSNAYDCSVDEIVNEYKRPEGRVRQLKEELTKSAQNNPAILNSLNIFFDNLGGGKPPEKLLKKLNI